MSHTTISYECGIPIDCIDDFQLVVAKRGIDLFNVMNMSNYTFVQVPALQYYGRRSKVGEGGRYSTRLFFNEGDGRVIIIEYTWSKDKGGLLKSVKDLMVDREYSSDTHESLVECLISLDGESLLALTY